MPPKREQCRALGAGTLIVIADRALSEQQTITNMPSVDQAERGRVFALYESQVRNSHHVSFRQHDELCHVWRDQGFRGCGDGVHRGYTARREHGTGHRLGGASRTLPVASMGHACRVDRVRRQIVLLSLRGRGMELWNYVGFWK